MPFDYQRLLYSIFRHLKTLKRILTALSLFSKIIKPWLMCPADRSETASACGQPAESDIPQNRQTSLCEDPSHRIRSAGFYFLANTGCRAPLHTFPAPVCRCQVQYDNSEQLPILNPCRTDNRKHAVYPYLLIFSPANPPALRTG